MQQPFLVPWVNFPVNAAAAGTPSQTPQQVHAGTLHKMFQFPASQSPQQQAAAAAAAQAAQAQQIAQLNAAQQYGAQLAAAAQSLPSQIPPGYHLYQNVPTGMVSTVSGMIPAVMSPAALTMGGNQVVNKMIIPGTKVRSPAKSSQDDRGQGLVLSGGW